MTRTLETSGLNSTQSGAPESLQPTQLGKIRDGFFATVIAAGLMVNGGDSLARGDQLPSRLIEAQEAATDALAITAEISGSQQGTAGSEAQSNDIYNVGDIEFFINDATPTPISTPENSPSK